MSANRVFILLGSDDYRCREILDVYSTRELAEQAVKNKTHLLISRNGDSTREIIETAVVGVYS